MVMTNLAKTVVENGGSIIPLIIPAELTNGTGLTNPSVFVDGDKIYVNLRHVQYTLYHTNGKYETRWGPLAYLNPENDVTLRTTNFFLEIKDDKVVRVNKVDTSQFDVTPVWEFIGLEDARLVKWDNKWYLSGVRRDTKTNGEGRMEISEIEIGEDYVKEISRSRIPAPGNDDSYCEKNWMPIIDRPFEYIKWSNSTEIVKADPVNLKCDQVFLSHDYKTLTRDLRGGSQVIKFCGYNIAITHEVDLWRNKNNNKNAVYRHRFAVWDENWNLVKVSEEFDFMTGLIEFCCGMAECGDDILVTFGFGDNTAYMLKIPKTFLKSFLGLYDTFNELPEAYYISFVTDDDRRQVLRDQFYKYGITKGKPFISTYEDDAKNIVSGKFIHHLEPKAMNCVVSHIRAIKDWYYNSDSLYALFLEDDTTLETSEYWNFTWDDFMSLLPTDCNCVQLTCIKENLSEVKFRKRQWDDWSTTYIITRTYAKTLIDRYCIGENEYILNTPSDTMPIVENILFDSPTVYNFPLFAENTNFKSTFYKQTIEEEHKKDHISSAAFVINWWKENGKNTNIEDLMKL